MSKLIQDYCNVIENERVKTLSLSLKLNRREQELLERFKGYVAGKISEQLGEGETPKINEADLLHRLIFTAIASEREFMRGDKPSRRGDA